MGRGPYDRAIADSRLYSLDPSERRETAQGLGRLARRAMTKRVGNWPPYSPGAANAWLLMVTTKPPTWRDPLMLWRDEPPTLGEPNQAFFYPDPLGFWAEVRRWATVLARLRQPKWAPSDALSVTTLLHLGDEPGRLTRARELMRPHLVLFLDEPSWQASGLDVDQVPHHVPDPHRPGQVYAGFWGTASDGTIMGKAPQHPSTHKFYRAEDMDGFLRAAPLS